MSKTRKLLGVADEIADAAALMEAAFQLADTLPADQIEPMQAVIYAAQKRLLVGQAKLVDVLRERTIPKSGTDREAKAAAGTDSTQVSA